MDAESKPAADDAARIILGMGLLNEATLVFARQDSDSALWRSVCEQARWLLPSHRIAVLLYSDGQRLKVEARYERGHFLAALAEPLQAAGDMLDTLPEQSEALWHQAPWPAPVDPFRAWAYSPDISHLLGVPMRYARYRCGLLLFGFHASVQSTVLTALASAFALHACLRHALLVAERHRHELERQKEELQAVVTHELRSPLTALLGGLDLLNASAGPTLVNTDQQLLQIARRNGARLLQIINDLLDLDKLETGALRLHCQSVALAPLLHECLQSLSAYGLPLGVVFRLKGAAEAGVVQVDPDRLQQVLTNLLSNAAKFSPAGAEVVLAVLPRPQCLRLEVRDHGPGIPATMRDRIFEKFVQLDAGAGARRPGTGLGLAIAKSLVLAMGGQIGVTSSDAGSTFWLEFPVA